MVVAEGDVHHRANDDFAIKAVAQTRLAYVLTGNADVDSIVKAGLSGLTLFLAQRTALEAGEPVGVDPAGRVLMALVWRTTAPEVGKRVLCTSVHRRAATSRAPHLPDIQAIPACPQPSPEDVCARSRPLP